MLFRVFKTINLFVFNSFLIKKYKGKFLSSELPLMLSIKTNTFLTIYFTLFSQIASKLDKNSFKNLVQQYESDKSNKGFNSWTHLKS